MKTVTIYKPNRMGLLDEMDSLMQAMWTNNEAKIAVPFHIDIYETENSYQLDADLPGFDDSNIDIEVKENLLSIKGELKEQASEDHKYLVKERRLNKFYRSFVLPKNADANNIAASMKNGVLHLSIAKKEEAKPRKIDIQ